MKIVFVMKITAILIKINYSYAFSPLVSHTAQVFE